MYTNCSYPYFQVITMREIIDCKSIRTYIYEYLLSNNVKIAFLIEICRS